MDEPVLLIVDDDKIIRKTIAYFSQSKGFETLEAKNGLEALALLEDVQPSLIISDIEMPKMDGLQLLKELSKRDIGIPIVIMTGFGSIEYAVEAMKNGAADFLSKPLDLAYFLKVVKRVLERSAMEKKLKEQQRQLDDDLHHAALFQTRLLPDNFETPYLLLNYRYQPMIAIGGDYLTVHKYSDQKIAVALYDVCGHGVTAAFVAHLAHSQLQRLLADHRPPSNVIELLNQYIEKAIRGTNLFITMIVVVIDAEEGSLTACNAGHPELIIWRKKFSRLESVPSNVPVVGFMKKILGKNNESRVDLTSGDRVILYTDGFEEARSRAGILMDHKGLMDMIRQYGDLPPQSFLHSMFDHLERYRDRDQEDDLTLLVVDIK